MALVCLFFLGFFIIDIICDYVQLRELEKEVFYWDCWASEEHKWFKDGVFCSGFKPVDKCKKCPYQKVF